jgi:hypothetical protein
MEACHMELNPEATGAIVERNRNFRPSTIQNDLRTKQFMRKSNRVAAHALQNNQTGLDHRPRLSKRMWETFVRSQHFVRHGTAYASAKLLTYSARASSCKRLHAAAVAGTESPGSKRMFSVLCGFPTAARGRCIYWEPGFQCHSDVSGVVTWTVTT